MWITTWIKIYISVCMSRGALRLSWRESWAIPETGQVGWGYCGMWTVKVSLVTVNNGSFPDVRAIWVLGLILRKKKAIPVSSVDPITVTIILCSLMCLSSTSLYHLIATMAFQINVKLFVGGRDCDWWWWKLCQWYLRAGNVLRICCVYWIVSER